MPTCSCLEGFIGNPFTSCRVKVVFDDPGIDQCNPSPCGPNSKCREFNGQPVCSCQETYIGSPPNCKPECTVNSECAQNKACHKFRCTNPCAGTCGLNARCEVINHNPICSCPQDMTGDPFTKCNLSKTISYFIYIHLLYCYFFLAPKENKPTMIAKPKDPCNPSPCGLYAECRRVGETPSCSCMSAYIGSPPNCRPECIVNTDCASDKSCIAEKCRDPCEGSCGFNTDCRVQNHIPICTCKPRYTGDPFNQCFEIIGKI